MSYRDTTSALVSRRARLVAELAEARRAADELARTVESLPRLERDLAEIDGLLASGAARALPALDHLRVASPCKADWDGMLGDDRVRFCAQCGKNVYNLSDMAREEAEAFLREIEAAPCVRFYRRADGTVLTTDCPVGVRRKRTKHAALAVGVNLLAAATGITGTTLAPSEPPTAPVVDRSHAVEPAPHETMPRQHVDEGPGRPTMGLLAPRYWDHMKLADPKPRPAGGQGCTPPYEIDAQGKKRWKLECL
jgi:hypothetical protein